MFHWGISISHLIIPPTAHDDSLISGCRGTSFSFTELCSRICLRQKLPPWPSPNTKTPPQKGKISAQGAHSTANDVFLFIHVHLFVHVKGWSLRRKAESLCSQIKQQCLKSWAFNFAQQLYTTMQVRKWKILYCKWILQGTKAMQKLVIKAGSGPWHNIYCCCCFYPVPLIAFIIDRNGSCPCIWHRWETQSLLG